MATPVEALEAALNNDSNPDTRKTFGKVEYALIPVSVVEAVIADEGNFADYDGEDLDETEYDDENVNADEPVEDGTAEVAGPSPDGFPDNEADGEVATDAPAATEGDEEE